MQIEITGARLVTIIDGLRAYVHSERGRAPDWKAKEDADARMRPYIKTIEFLEEKLKEAKEQEERDKASPEA